MEGGGKFLGTRLIQYFAGFWWSGRSKEHECSAFPSPLKNWGIHMGNGMHEEFTSISCDFCYILISAGEDSIKTPAFASYLEDIWILKEGFSITTIIYVHRGIYRQIVSHAVLDLRHFMLFTWIQIIQFGLKSPSWVFLNCCKKRFIIIFKNKLVIYR